MCGFVGVVSTSHNAAEHEAALCKATRLLAHRGPDDEAFYVSPAFCAGFRRLKIIDLSDDARQPLGDASGRYWIVFNGEIYNYRELRDELCQAGRRFRTQSDTEVLLQAWIHWGEDCLARLNGMFAFLVWDARERTLFAARDRFGEKPLFYAVANDGVYFASEIKALFPLLGHVPDYRPGIVFKYLYHGMADWCAETFYDGVHRLMPAHKLCLRAGTITVARYWSPTAGRPPDGDPVEAFRELFLDSLRLRLRSDVPVGTCLSGGLDSGAIVCGLSHVVQDGDWQATRKTFTAAYPQFDESREVNEVNQRSGSEGHSIVPRPRGLADLQSLLWFHDEPFHSFTVFASSEVMRLAREQGVTVLLNGQGADELLAGYQEYTKYYLRDLMKQGRILAMVRASRGSRDFLALRPLSALREAGRQWLLECGAAAKRFLVPGGRRARVDAISRGCLSPHFVVEAAADQPDEPRRVTRGGALKRRLHDSAALADLPLYLRIEDRNSMAHSLESRLPFLDHRLAELAFAMPTELLMRGGANKYVLREAMRGILPEPVRLRRTKYGFPTPEVDWIYRDFVDEVRDTLASSRLASSGIFDAPSLRRRFDQQAARYRAGSDLTCERSYWFRVVSLDLWLRECQRRSAEAARTTELRATSLEGAAVVNSPPLHAARFIERTA